MNLLDIVLLSVVEGVSEFLPISSTGHLILVSQILHIPSSEFVKTFAIVIQLGAILAASVLYTRRVLSNPKIILKLIVGFIPTALVGLAFYKIIKNVFFESPILVASMLILGGVALIGVELYLKRTHKVQKEKYDLSSITYKQSVAIGVFQSVSVIPGVSRAAATIFGGLFVGLPRREAVEFSFLLALPTMAAASGLDLIKTSSTFTSTEIQQLILGTFLSFLVALASIKWLLKYIESHTFIPFGIYRIIVGILFLLLFLA